MKKQRVAGLLAAAMMTPAAALAQDSNENETFIGVSVGYHGLGVGSDEADGVELDDASPIFGVVAGADFPIGGNLFAGVEGNFHFGTDAVDHEYGALARFGIADSSGTKYYLRGGYQEIELDVEEILDIELDDGESDGVDTSEGDLIVGAGIDIPLAGGKLRFNVDTVSFDTVRGTTGFVFSF